MGKQRWIWVLHCSATSYLTLGQRLIKPIIIATQSEILGYIRLYPDLAKEGILHFKNSSIILTSNIRSNTMKRLSEKTFNFLKIIEPSKEEL